MRAIQSALGIAAALLIASDAASAYTLWYNASDLRVTGGASSPVRGPQGYTFTTTSPPFGICQFEIGLDVPSNVSVTGVQVCYSMSQVGGAYIYLVDLFDNANPATPLFHADTQLTSTTRTCTALAITPHTPTAPLTARIGLVPAASGQSVTIAAVGLDVELVTVAVPAEKRSGGLDIGASFPNPTRHQAVIEFEQPAGEAVRLEIHDAAGRLIRRLDPGSGSGHRQVVWDGRDATGRDVATGMYFYRIATTRTTSESRRVVIVR